MGDHELEVSGKLGFPEFAGFAARIEGRYRFTRSERGREYVEALESEAGLSRDALVERIEADERARDTFMTAGDRAAEVRDSDYRQALATVVAAALDDAKVDEAEHLLAQLLTFEAVHLRALVGAFYFTRDIGGGRGVQSQAGDATFVQGGATVTPASVAQSLGASVRLATAVIGTLTAAGMLEQVPGKPGQDLSSMGGVGRGPTGPPTWKTTGWALSAIQLMYPKLDTP